MSRIAKARGISSRSMQYKKSSFVCGAKSSKAPHEMCIFLYRYVSFLLSAFISVPIRNDPDLDGKRKATDRTAHLQNLGGCIATSCASELRIAMIMIDASKVSSTSSGKKYTAPHAK